MPTYQYQCDECGHEFEEFQRITDDPIDTCTRCHGHCRRLISGGAGFLLRGTGFYSTDYRSESYKKAAELDSPKPIVNKSKDTKSGPSSGTEAKSEKVKKDSSSDAVKAG